MKKYRFLSFITALFLMLPFIAVCHAESDSYSALSGDVNNDGIINVLDAELLSYQLIGIQNDSFNELNADLNHNEKVDVFDYINLIMIILGINQSVVTEQLIPDNTCSPDYISDIKDTDNTPVSNILSDVISEPVTDISEKIPQETYTADSENQEIQNNSDNGPNSELSESQIKIDEVFSLINEIRISNGLNPFTQNENLDLAAGQRAVEISKDFSHKRPDSSSCFTVLDEYDLFYMAAGENIALGSPTAKGVVEQWMNSKGHRDNILNPNYSCIGIGYYKTDETNYCWTQLFIG